MPLKAKAHSKRERSSITNPLADALPYQGVDKVIGEQIRLRRTAIRLSQTALAEKLGMSYQQIQKYEWGINRVSSSTLYDIARTLQVPVSFFFDTLPSVGPQAGDDAMTKSRSAYLATLEGQNLVDTFRSLPPQVRTSVLEMMIGLGRCGDFTEGQRAAGSMVTAIDQR